MSKTISESRTAEDYRPSDELLNAFANLPDAIRYEEQSIKHEPEGNYDTFLSQISIIFMIFMIDSVIARLELGVKEEPCEIQMPERRFSSLSDRKQLPTRPSTSRTTMDSETPRQLAPDNSRYNSNVQVKPEPLDESKAFFSSNRHFPVPVAHDRQRSMFPPSDYGNSQSSRDPRKRPSK